MKLQDRETLLFIGDSVTDAGRQRPIGIAAGDGLGNGFVKVVDTLLNVYYPEQFFQIFNMGCSGHTSRDLLARWQTDVFDLNPDIVVLCIGFNDVWRQFDSPARPSSHVLPDEYRTNMRTMIEDTIPKVRELILMTPYYLEKNRDDDMRKKMDEYGTIVKELADEYSLSCVDLQKEFDDYLTYRYPAYVMWDRVHPGAVGGFIIARTLLRELLFDRQII